MASKYLCAPPCGVASKRLFSTAGDISIEIRNHVNVKEFASTKFRVLNNVFVVSLIMVAVHLMVLVLV